MYDIQIQIVNYKSKKYLFECLESVSKDLAGVSFSYHIAVLDNASGDDLSDILTQFPSLKSVEVVQRSEEHTSELQSHFHLLFLLFFFKDPAPPEISPLPLHDALPILFSTMHRAMISPTSSHNSPLLRASR